jgi:hypothetical protein
MDRTNALRILKSDFKRELQEVPATILIGKILALQEHL